MGVMENKPDFTVIGAAVLDVLARPVSSNVFTEGSVPAEDIHLTFGGDALNEAVCLSRLGGSVSLVTILGEDEAGDMVLSFLERNGVDPRYILRRPIPTGINMVLVDEMGERCFVTNPRGTLRHLTKDMILPAVDSMADIVSFASIFVSHDLTPAELETVFAAIRDRPGRILTADFTKAKHGETLGDLRRLLPYLSIAFINQAEAYMLTGEQDPVENARTLIRSGVSCAVVKTGKDGCILCQAKDGKCLHIRAYPDAFCVDTTGAGDSFAAGFLYAMRGNMPLEDCAVFGCALASCCIEGTGATDPIGSKDQVLQRFERMMACPDRVEPV